MNELILQLSESEQIKIVSKNGQNFKDISYCCGEFIIYFIYNDNELIIGQENTPGEFCVKFMKQLKNIINNKLLLHKSITQNLGFMQNQYYQDKTGFFKVPASKNMASYWIGFDYQMCSTSSNNIKPSVSTWLYNSFNTIIFEVTKDYPWHFMILEGNSSDQDFQTYEEFMKNYKPLITRVIPQQVAVEWLEQVKIASQEIFPTEEIYLDFYNSFDSDKS